MAAHETLAVASVVLDKLNDEIPSDNLCSWDLKTEFQKLRGTVLCFKEMLSESDLAGEDHLPRVLRLQVLLNDADKLVDDIAVEKEKQITSGCSSCIGRKVRHYSSSSNPLVFHPDMAFKIRNINRMLDNELKGFSKCPIPLSMSMTIHTHQGRKYITSVIGRDESDVNPSKIIGRDEEKEKMIQLILTQEPEPRVVPIVGIGGVGKTSLAQLVYDDERVKLHFELRGWSHVGTEFSTNIVGARIISLVRDPLPYPVRYSYDYNMDSKLLKYLGGKRYLFVLDDVHYADPETCSSIQHLLMKTACNGSRIIVTTRHNDVAENVGTVPPFWLQGLSSRDSCSLYLHRIFRHVQYEEIGTDNVTDYGRALMDVGDRVEHMRDIVTKCDGIPLAIREMAFTLSRLTTIRNLNARDSEMWEIPGFQCDSLLSISSYDRMALDLRICFKYSAFFPKNHELHSFELNQFWETFGLIGSKATGMDNLRRLCSLSLLKECKGEPAFCFKYKIPQLIHDIARWLATRGEFAMVKPSTPFIGERKRHLFISSHAPSLLQDNIGDIQTLSFADRVEESLVESFVQQCQLLRVLILRNSGLKAIPSGIKGLKRLQYLDLTGNKGVKEIPNFICMLQTLETLLLEGCTAVEELPRDIMKLSHLTMLSITTQQSFLAENGVGRLTSLRFLAFIGCPYLKYLPQGIHLLTSLATLIIRDCNSLISLPRSMKYLIALETLIISNCPWLRLNRKVEDREGHLNAVGLSLHRCCLASLPLLSDLPQWLVRKSSRTLKFLHVEDCQSFKWIPDWFTEDNLTSLEEVEILNCKNLSHPKGIKPSFSALKKIKIKGCPNLTQHSLSTQIASPSQIECESFEAAQEATTSTEDGAAGPSSSSVMTPLNPPTAQENFGSRKPAQGLATILSIGTANPANYILQDDFTDYYFRVTKSEHMTQLKENFKHICDKAKVRKRHFVLTEEMINKNPDIRTKVGKSLDIRHHIITSEVPKLALEAASKAIKEWGQPKSHITHLIFAAVSGVNMLGADYHLTKLLGLSASVRRTMICSQSFYASGTMLRMAKDIVENNAGSRVLVVSSDISIDTFCGPNESDTPSLIANATTGDGAAALIIGADLDVLKEKPLFQIVSVKENTVPDSDGAINGHGLSLYLTAEDVPEMIANYIENSLKQALSPFDIADWNSFFWIIHPGGNAIMDRIETKLGLKKEKLWTSQHVLSEFGNMSTATVFFALDEMRRKSVEAGKATTGDGLEWGIVFGSGAGSTIDTVVLRSFATNTMC